MSKTCATPNCTNRDDQGNFQGHYCYPCWEHITQRKGTTSQAYRNEKENENV